MNVWWWLLWIALAASIWGFCVGFFRAMGYDLGMGYRARKERR